LAIHAGTPRGSAGRASLGPPGERPEARGDGLAASGTGSWGDDGLGCETGGDSDGPPRLAWGSRLGAWSDGAGQQAASPTSSKRPRRSARRGHGTGRQGREGRMAADLSGDGVAAGSGAICASVLLMRHGI
jgi:hypothetical protein